LWARLNLPADRIAFVTDLYRKYAADLRDVRSRQKALRAARTPFGLSPQLCDVEAEITYLFLREFKPETVVEISPSSGWSTMWILNALKDNGKGRLYSYDLIDTSTRVVPAELAVGRWTFCQGDVTKNVDKLPPVIDYLFIDSDHAAPFARWYIRDIFPRLKPGTHVSAHDILKRVYDSGWGEESTVLLTWLADKGVPCFTASKRLRGKGFDAVQDVKQELGLTDPVHASDFNSMVYFTV
jgi:predicted O-methyltransferase YrrM